MIMWSNIQCCKKAISIKNFKFTSNQTDVEYGCEIYHKGDVNIINSTFDSKYIWDHGGKSSS